MYHVFSSPPPFFAIHGGAGDLSPDEMAPEVQEAYIQALEKVTWLGCHLTEKGGSALEWVTQLVAALEDEPLFNAGKGSVFTAEGIHEMDAAVMCGKTGKAGAIAGVTCLRNPVQTARKVLDEKDLVMLSGGGAEAYARMKGMIFVEPEYFATPYRREQWEKSRKSSKMILDHHKYGTVGAVAVDAAGNCAAATSTGGLTNKRFGRIGDSPVVGAGTFADNATCAVSCTGYGEPFLLRNAAYQVSARMQFAGNSCEEAVRKTVEEDLPSYDGDGGMIVVSPKQGKIVLAYNSSMMFRGWGGLHLSYGTGIA